MNQFSTQLRGIRPRLVLALALAFIGLFFYILGVRPSIFGLDLSPVVGFVQIAVFMIGLAMMCLGGYVVMNLLWEGNEKTITADIGYRLVATGYVVAAAAAMADTLGFGSQPFPTRQYFGLWQAVGVIVGEIIIAGGFLMMIPRRERQDED